MGVDRTVGVASPQFINNSQYSFTNWSDGGAQTHTVRTPAVATTYTANLAVLPQPPAPWVSNDIGARTVTGTSSYTNDTFTIKGGGNDIWDTTDEFRYVNQPLAGDGEITARITSQSNTNPWAKSGIMIKESAAANAKYVMVGITPSNGVHMQYNFTGDQGGGAYTLPNAWLKLKRAGNVFTSYSSADGINWTTVGTTTVAMTSNVTVGLFVNAHNDTTQNVTTFDNVIVTVPTNATLPSPWQRVDIGATQPAGSASATNGTFTVKGGGTAMWADADQAGYAYQTLNGDGSITARVTSQSNTDAWAKSGIMFKEATAANSKYVSLFITPSNGIHMQYNFTGDQSGGAYTLPNAWLRLVRTGNVFTAYKSVDGASWTQVGQTTLAMNISVTFGMFVNAHNGGTSLNTSTYDNVSLTGSTGSTLPAPWASNDIGSPTVAGASSFSNNMFTVKGAGTDIWDTADQFQFASRTLVGDGEITARVISQSNTDPWAKSGIMIKSSLTARSAYASIFITPSNGVHMQYNFTGDQGGGTYTLPNAWLKLKRVGSTITTYKSVDGTNWTLVGTTTVTLPETARIGLFVNAHNGGTNLNTTTFDTANVQKY
ncbi:hypothetical protein BH09PAT3_BH09PAT3_3160 [soil metagenome]